MSDLTTAPSGQAPHRGGQFGPDYLPHGHDYTSITHRIGSIALARTAGTAWLGLFGIGMILLTIFIAVVIYLLVKGVGIWGINIPVGWSFAITSFVWWVGIGHAGTLISAIMFLMHQKW